MKAVTKSLHRAIEREDLALAQGLVEASGGHTTLHVACRCNKYLGIISYLVQTCKANVEAATNYQRKPLRLVSFWNNTELVKYLVNLGGTRVDAEVGAQPAGRGVILHYAASWKTTNPMLRCLVLDCGININATDDWGRTALHVACQFESANLVRFLVETRRADILAKDKSGRTALHRAVLSIENPIEKSRILILAAGGAAVMAIDNAGRAALHLAASQAFRRKSVPSWSILRLLVEHVVSNWM